METKKDIRNRILSERKNLSKEEWEEKSRCIYEKVIKHPLFLNTNEIYCYIDFRNEAGTRNIICKAWESGKKTAVPKVSGNEMDFFYITSFDELKEGYYGILEPTTNLKADALEALIIMPGAAFDKSCSRIGYGGGFYDKYLEKNPAHHTLALSFELQIVDDIPAEPYDRKPEVIITEDNIYEEELFTGRWL